MFMDVVVSPVETMIETGAPIAIVVVLLAAVIGGAVAITKAVRKNKKK